MNDAVSPGSSPGEGPGTDRPASGIETDPAADRAIGEPLPPAEGFTATGVGDPGEPLSGSPSHLDPRVRFLWSLGAGGIMALVGLGLAGVAAIQGVWTLAAGLVCLTIASASVLVIVARLAWSRWTWTAYEDALELRHGVVVSSSSLVPYHRIQQIDLHRGPVQRVFGLSRLVLRTAAATSDASLPGLGEAEADRLRYQLLRRAGVDDAV